MDAQLSMRTAPACFFHMRQLLFVCQLLGREVTIRPLGRRISYQPSPKNKVQLSRKMKCGLS